jgi:Flp pilus assembly protein TadG
MSTKTSTDNKSEVKLRRGESGQAIVLMALVAVFLIGMLGLAIDGGGMYFLWRDAQNASDAAVMAGTYARCTKGNSAQVVKAGLAAAALNGFDNNGTTNTVAIYNPPIDGAGVGNLNYIQVNITAKKPSYFIQVVYKNPLQVTTRAVGFCIPPLDPTTIPAVFAGSLTCTNAIHWTNSESSITGGLFSNTDILMGGGGQGNVIIGDSGAVGTVDYHDQNSTWYKSDGTTTTLPANNAPAKTDPLNLQMADYVSGGSAAKRAALYKSIISSADDPTYNDGNNTWKPDNGTPLEGLYYVDGNVDIGTNVDVNGDRNGDGRHDGLTIVATGDIKINVGSGMDLHYYSGGGGDGIITYSGSGLGDPCGHNSVDVSGSAASVVGVIYAPNGGVNFNLSNLTMRGAIIANTITMGGSNFTLVYDPTLIPPRPPSVNVAE